MPGLATAFLLLLQPGLLWRGGDARAHRPPPLAWKTLPPGESLWKRPPRGLQRFPGPVRTTPGDRAPPDLPPPLAPLLPHLGTDTPACSTHQCPLGAPRTLSTPHDHAHPQGHEAVQLVGSTARDPRAQRATEGRSTRQTLTQASTLLKFLTTHLRPPYAEHSYPERQVLAPGCAGILPSTQWPRLHHPTGEAELLWSKTGRRVSCLLGSSCLSGGVSRTTPGHRVSVA